jgi:phosphatidylglycerol:prolipoprotein diacylglycerol transferase
MLPVVQIGPAALPLAPLLIMLGVWAGAWLAERAGARLGLSPDAISALVFAMLVGWLLGARLGYAARFLPTYAADPLSLLSPNPATLWPAAGIAGAALAGLLIGRRRGLPLWRTLDALAPALALLALALGAAHLASGDAFGAPARLPWSIWLWDDWRHPSQIYELIAAAAILVLQWRSQERAPFDGFRFLLVLALLAAARVFLEAFRGDSWIVGGGLRGAQVISLLVLAACLALLRVRGQASTATPQSPADFAAQETTSTEA